MEKLENKYFVHSIISQEGLSSHIDKLEQRNKTDINSMSDFWSQDIGINIIPASTKDKITFENWSKWQD